MNKSMFPWQTQTGVGDGPAAGYNQDEANEFFRFFDVANPAIEGVVSRRLNEFAPSVNVSLVDIDIDTGVSYCYGRYWNDVGVTTLTPPALAADTAGRVVLRATWATNLIRPVILMATTGSLVAPAVTQTAGTIWEISLCSFIRRAADGHIFANAADLGAGTPTGVTDERTYVGERTIKTFIPAIHGYNSTDAVALRASLGAVVNEPAFGLFAPANKLSFATGSAIIPHDYLDINIVETVIDYNNTIGGGNLVMATSTAIIECPGASAGGPLAGPSTIASPTNLACVLPITANTNIVAGKALSIVTTRNGVAAADTAPAGLGLYGWFVEYRSRGFL